MQSQQDHMRNLKIQIGQLGSALNNKPSRKLAVGIQVPGQEDAKECKTVELRAI